MNVLIRSPKTVRGKGLRSVNEEIEGEETTLDRNSAHSKLFRSYLSEHRQNREPISKLRNPDKFTEILRDKKELQTMNLILLAKVLLFLDSGGTTSEEISEYLNYPIIKQSKNTEKSKKTKTEIDREKLDFIRYMSFVMELLNKTQDIEDISENNKMIQPESFGY
jgi:hypothetical protein